MSKVFIEDTTLTAIGNAIRGKAGTSDLIDPANMAQEITNLPTGGDIDPSAFAVTSTMESFDIEGCINPLITKYGHLITTSDITSLKNAFTRSYITDIPFVINCDRYANYNAATDAFAYTRIKRLPKINNWKWGGNSNSGLGREFQHSELEIITDEDVENWNYDNLHTVSSYTFNDTFRECYYLRKISKNLIKNLYTKNTRSYSSFRTMFQDCHALDEIESAPVPPVTTSQNLFSNNNEGFVGNTYHLKKFVFDTDNGIPYVRNWSNQILDLSTSGYGNIKSNNGAFKDYPEIIDSETYNLYKNNPDAWTKDVQYSRYNHDSAVETINSLPDCSSSGGVNTIKFKGDAGSATDGGAINTLTEEEIAVATAKGWTVSLV